LGFAPIGFGKKVVTASPGIYKRPRLERGCFMGLRAGILLLLILSWGGAPAGAAPEAGALLTLAEAMLLALQHHPSLKAAGMTVETAEADLAGLKPGDQMLLPE